MHAEPSPFEPRNILASWLMAAFAVPATLLVAAIGQGIGGWLGGCSWIGMTLPLSRPVWALVNEPSIHFASLGAADGYWLGSLLLPAMVALLAPSLVPRHRSVGAELLMVQLAWASAVIGFAWLPLLDRTDGHLSHWLDFHRLSPSWVWAAPAVAAVLGIPAVRRLLRLLATSSPHAGPAARAVAVVLHLWLPVTGWILVAGIASGSVPVPAVTAVTIPCILALALAVAGGVGGHVRALEPVDGRTWIYALAACLVIGALVVVAGRPLPQRRAAGMLWGRPLATNNIRDWVLPRRLYRVP